MGRIIHPIHIMENTCLKPPTRYRLIQYIYMCIIHIWDESSKSTRFNIFDMGWSQMYLLILWKIPWMLVFVERFGLLYHIHVDMWIISGMVAKGQLWYQLGSGCYTPHFRDGSQPTRRLFFRTKHGNVLNGEALNFQFLSSCSLTCTQSVIENFRKHAKTWSMNLNQRYTGPNRAPLKPVVYQHVPHGHRLFLCRYTPVLDTHTKKQKQTHINHMKLLQYVPGPVKSPHKILLSNVLPRVLSWFIYRPGQRETHRQASKVFCKSSETSLKYLPTGPWVVYLLWNCKIYNIIWVWINTY